MSSMTNMPITLRDAAAQNDAATVMQLIQAGVPIDEFDGAPLRAALRHAHPDIVRILVEAGADCQSNLDEFMSAALSNSDAVSLQLLIKHLKTQPIEGLSLVWYLLQAIQSRSAQSVQILIDAGADPKPKDQAPATTAAYVGSVEILRILQQHGADLYADNSAPLRNAIAGRHVEAVKFLVGADPNFNAQSADYLLLAMENGDAEIFEILLRAGAKLDHPIHIAKDGFNNSVAMLMLLESYGCSIQPFADDLALWAVDSSSAKTLKHILEYCTVSRNILDEGLILAARDSVYPIFELLIKHHADASANHSAALKSVILNGGFPVARLLLSAGAQISDLDSSSVAHVIFREEKEIDRELLITLLQRGVTVAGLNLGEVLAERFFIHVPANTMLRDASGEFFPKKIRDERKTFVRNTAQTLNGSPDFEKRKIVASWYTEFLVDLQLSDWTLG